ncbi:ribonuclease T2 isoform X1 [Carassius gibelio]|uniref:ribonuclease T2 isoform X1 n=1 Tax=Carassius gibelio TaxID=101364 RepID=UPI002279A61E|nr:ribonuclease T2 isoform X1 [Carassius gibelio]XP_052429317.1 ribonuclease T2 isoform X1 [Carassius gibelio]
MRFIAVAVIFCAGCFWPTASAHPRKEWTKLILTHQWPETFCSVEKNCTTNVSFWTLHGLWPDSGMMCNTSWHFNASLIEDLIPEMKKYWPDLLKPSSPEFWEYEWTKHGTCAAKADSLNSQHKYFSKALELYKKFNLTNVLESNRIVPSEQQHYTLDEVETAITSFYNVKTKIQCVHPVKGDQVQILGQIEICVDRDFQLIDCQKSIEEICSNDIPAVSVSGQSELRVCDHSTPVYYPPVPSRS